MLIVPPPLWKPPTAAAGSWQTLWSAAGGSNSSGWNGYTMRAVIARSSWNAITGTPSKIRATVKAASTVGFTLDGLYASAKADSGDAYDAQSALTQILFGGSGSVTVGSAASQVSDDTSFVLDQTRDLLLSAHFSATSSVADSGTISGFTAYFKSATSEAGTADATTGYTVATTHSYMFTKVEVYA